MPQAVTPKNVRTNSTSTQGTLDMNTNTQANSPSASPSKKGTPPAFSIFLKDKESGANIPLGAAWANTMPDGNVMFGINLSRDFVRDNSNPKYEDSKERFLDIMEKVYDGELYWNMAHSSNRTGGARTTARDLLAKDGRGVGAGEVRRDGFMKRLVRALFNL